MSCQRWSKIARLAKADRDTIHHMLRDGSTYGQIMEKLGSAMAGINKQNLSLWRNGAHQEWLREQDRLAEIKARRELTFDVVRQNISANPHEVALQLATAQIYDTLGEFDVSRLKALLHERPEQYAQIVNTVVKLSKGAVEVEKLKLNASDQKRKIEAELGQARTDGGLTPETLGKIEEALKLL